MTDSNKLGEKEAAKEALKAREKDMKEREAKLNEGKTGKGLRSFLGLTRGRNPQEIQYEAFDDEQADTLPKTLSEFMELTKVNDEPVIVGYLIDGFNSAQYSAASDPVAEFYEAGWTPEFRTMFRNNVKSFAAQSNLSIEDTVAVLKPAILAGLAKAAENAKTSA